jgi:hypothetical protein
MEDNLKPLECSDDDVVSFGNQTCKLGILKKAINHSFENGMNYYRQSGFQDQRIETPRPLSQADWFKKDADCEILNLGSHKWTKGKMRVKFSVEFYVEAEEEQKINDPDSLDDLRRELNQDNS